MVFPMISCRDSLHYVFLGTDLAPPVPEVPGASPAVRNTPWRSVGGFTGTQKKEVMEMGQMGKSWGNLGDSSTETEIMRKMSL